MKLRLCVLLLLTILVETTAWSEDMRSLVVWLKSGKTVVLNLETLPKTVFKEGNIDITATGFSTSYPISEVLKFTNFTQDEIDHLPSLKDNPISITQRGNEIVLANLPEKAAINVYSVDGVKAMTIPAPAMGQATIDLDHLPVGIYVIKINTYNYKFMKR